LFVIVNRFTMPADADADEHRDKYGSECYSEVCPSASHGQPQRDGHTGQKPGKHREQEEIEFAEAAAEARLRWGSRASRVGQLRTQDGEIALQFRIVRVLAQAPVQYGHRTGGLPQQVLDPRPVRSELLTRNHITTGTIFCPGLQQQRSRFGGLATPSHSFLH